MKLPFSPIIRLTADEKIGLISNLSTMLAAGIPILEAVESLLDEAKGNVRKILETLVTDLKAGNRMYVSLSKYPDVFSLVTVSLIKASEEAGTLETTLKDIRLNIQQESEFTDKIKSAMTYPMVVMFVFVAVMLGILLFVIPRVATVFGRMNVPLPLATQIMFAMSNTLINDWPKVLAGLIVFIGVFASLFHYKRDWFIAAFFNLPVVRDLIRLIDLTRFARSMYLLLSAGLPIAIALELAEKVVMKKKVQQLLSNAREMVISGKNFSEGLRDQRKIVPGMMVKLIEVGERSGTLADSMRDISAFMDYTVSKKLKTVTELLEPLMLVFVGLAVGVMMMAVIAPMYGVITSVVK